MEETKNTLMENEEVIETVVEEVVKTGSKLSTMGAVSLGVATGLAISIVAPKAIGFIAGKIAERKERQFEKDYVTEELENEDNVTELKSER